MKTIRILAIVALATALSSTAAFAKAKGQYRDLNLTPEQRTQIHQIHQARHAQMQELSKKSLTRQEFRTQATTIRHSSQEHVSSILTPDQRAKLSASNRKNGRMKRGQGRRKAQDA